MSFRITLRKTKQAAIHLNRTHLYDFDMQISNKNSDLLKAIKVNSELHLVFLKNENFI